MKMPSIRLVRRRETRSPSTPRSCLIRRKDGERRLFTSIAPSQSQEALMLMRKRSSTNDGKRYLRLIITPNTGKNLHTFPVNRRNPIYRACITNAPLLDLTPENGPFSLLVDRNNRLRHPLRRFFLNPLVPEYPFQQSYDTRTPCPFSAPVANLHLHHEFGSALKAEPAPTGGGTHGGLEET